MWTNEITLMNKWGYFCEWLDLRIWLNRVVSPFVVITDCTTVLCSCDAWTQGEQFAGVNLMNYDYEFEMRDKNRKL